MVKENGGVEDGETADEGGRRRDDVNSIEMDRDTLN